ncbi:MAG: hypothetical protein K6A44_00920 [bacterium]|nr:hypothetical protein [bacterium]
MRVTPLSFGKGNFVVSASKKANTVLNKPSRILGITVSYDEMVKNPATVTPKSIAEGIKLMQRAEAEGRYQDITNSIL